MLMIIKVISALGMQFTKKIYKIRESVCSAMERVPPLVN